MAEWGEWMRVWIGGWMNRWTEAHATAGFGLRQGGARNSLQCFHLKSMFSLRLLLLSKGKRRTGEWLTAAGVGC